MTRLLEDPLDSKKQEIVMIIEDDLIKKLLEVRDSEEIGENLPKIKEIVRKKIKTGMDERVYPVYISVGARAFYGPQGLAGYNVILLGDREGNDVEIAAADTGKEAVSIARKLASALDIDFKGVIESTEDPLKTKKPKDLSKEGEKDTKLQKLSDKSESRVNEQDEEEEEPPSPEPEEPSEEEKGPEIKRPEEEKPEVPEITKEYVGNTEDNHYYLISIEDDEGNMEDLQIVDQEGVEKFSAKKNSIPVENVAEFLAKGIEELQIESIEFGVFDKYLYPYFFEEEEEEEEAPEDLEKMEEEPEEEEPVERRKKIRESILQRFDDIVEEVYTTLDDQFELDRGPIPVEAVKDLLEIYMSSFLYLVLDRLREKYEVVTEGRTIESKKESKSHLLEMRITDHENNTFDVYLVDDGTMDTVIDINGREFRFDSEFSALWREEDGTLTEEGLEQLALDALSNLEEEEYNELLVQGQEEGTPPEEEAIENESKTNEARMGVDYVKGVRSSLKTATQALKDKDYDAAAKALEDVADDAADAAKAAKKMKREADSKAEAEKEKNREAKEGYETPGVRTGTGPAAGSFQRSVSDIGKRKAAGEPCPYDTISYSAYEELEQFLFRREREEHPNFEDEQIWQIVHDHLEELGLSEPTEPVETEDVDLPVESKTDEDKGEVGFTKEVFEVEYEKDGEKKTTRVMAFDGDDAKREMERNPKVKVLSVKRVSEKKTKESKGKNKELELTKSLLEMLQ